MRRLPLIRLPRACRMRGEERDVVSDCLLNAFRCDGQLVELSPGKLRALPGNGAKIGRRREQLVHDGLAPFGDEPNPVILNRREEALSAISYFWAVPSMYSHSIRARQ